MAALGGIGGTEYSLFSFFQRTKAVVAETEHFISLEHQSFNDIDSLERIHERLSEAGDTVFTLKQRALNLIQLISTWRTSIMTWTNYLPI
jgi:hypothetical protein